MSNPLVTFTVKRPVFTSVVYLIVITVGLFSLWRLPIDLMPEITFPTISVITSYSNAGPEEVEELVTRPLEGAVAGLQGIEQIVSTSSEGRSIVRVSFTWGTNLDEAVNDMRDRIDRVLGRLPEEVDRPMIRKFDLSSFPIMILGASSHLEPVALRELLEDQVQYRIERIDGVASVDIRGGVGREFHVSLRSDQLSALRISPDMVVSALGAENRNVPGGSVDRGLKEITVRTLAEFRGVEDIRNVVVVVRDGVPVRVGDVADVEDTSEEQLTFVRINGVPGITLSVSKQAGANTVAVAAGIRRELRTIARDLPQVQITPRIDTSVFIRQAINSVGISLLLGGLIAISVLLLFLRNVSSTLIIAVVIPISIIATFAILYFGGLTLNMMTFGGLALGIGMLVDNAIVVLDSIFHHREQGGPAAESAVSGASEVASAVTASTLTTLVVFLPVVFIRGMSGVMFRQLAYVVSFSISCSLVAALTLIPMLTSRFLRMPPAVGGTRTGGLSSVFARSEQFYRRVEQAYGRFLRSALHHRSAVLWGTAGLLVCSVALLPLIGVELVPSSDEGEVRVDVEMAVGTRVELTDSATEHIESIVSREVPEASYVLVSVGGGGWWGGSRSHTSALRIALVPKAQRRRSSADVAADLRRKLNGIPGATIRVREGQGLFILRMGASQDQSVAIEIRGHDLDIGQRLAQQVSDAVEGVEGVTDVRISREEGMPEYTVHIDRQRAADLGLTALQIGTAVQTAMGGTQATMLRTAGKEYPVIVRLAERDRLSAEQLARISLVTRSGEVVPLQSVATLDPGSGPVQIERIDRERAITVNVNYAGSDLKSVVGGIRARLRTISVPAEFSILVRGDYEEQQKAFKELMVGLMLAILLVYLVMAAQFESFRDPFIVLFSIPVALVGVVSILLLTGTPFSIQAYIGCIILAGIVVNNAIVLIDHINRLRREQGMKLYDAIAAGGTRRLRPIMMTALTTSLGLLPLSLALGEGGEAQAPMARVVIGGLIASSLITLVLIPVVYSLIEERRARRKVADA